MFKDKVVLITGAGRGIGRAVALAFGAAGARIVAVGQNPEALDSLVAELKALGGEAVGARGDISAPSDVDAVFETAVGAFGRVDVLVNNAGITRDGLLLRMKEEDWDAVLDVNLKGAFLCSKAAAKLMTKQRYGRIVNITSVVGQMGNPGQANYCASKSGLIGLTKSNARELARRNVTVNAVAPGFIVTDMTEALPEKVREELITQIPLERLGTADDVAQAVLFLAAEHSGYITGQVLGVNGGMYM